MKRVIFAGALMLATASPVYAQTYFDSQQQEFREQREKPTSVQENGSRTRYGRHTRIWNGPETALNSICVATFRPALVALPRLSRNSSTPTQATRHMPRKEQQCHL